MSIKKTMFWLVLFVIGIACFGVIGQAGEIEVTASKDILPWPISAKVTTETLPTKAGAALFRLTVTPTEHFDEACSSIVISMTNLRGTAYSGPEQWIVPLSEATPYTYVVNVTIPDNDTSAIEIGAGCTMTMDEARWFVTTGDTLEMYDQHPIGVSGKYAPSWLDQQRAKLTPEQLRKEFDIRVDLRHPIGRINELAEGLLRTLTPTDTDRVYLARVTLDEMLILQDWGVWITPLDHEAVRQEYPPSPDDDSPPPATVARPVTLSSHKLFWTMNTT